MLAPLLTVCFLAACTSSDATRGSATTGDRTVGSGSLDERPAVADQATTPSDLPVGSGSVADQATVPGGPPVVVHEGSAGCIDRPARRQSDDFETVTLGAIGGNDGVTVSAALYPLPETEGDPWSQWGQGVVLPDGRFVSAVGDHRGEDGTSWIFEYDPSDATLTRTVEVSQALGHREGDWGYGKVHAPMVLSTCGDVIAATYWGTRRDLVIGGSYQGDHLFRYDPFERTIDSLGVPVPGYGIPSIAISPDGRWIFGEAVHPESDPDAGGFFIADAETGAVESFQEDPDHVGFRSILVTADGRALYAIGDRGLMAVDPADGSTRRLTDVLPGEWLRAATAQAPDGAVYGATRDPDMLFRLDSDGEFTALGELEDYVASMAVSPDGDTVYYVPGAHGAGWELGTPVIAYDVPTGERRELVHLGPLVEQVLGVRAGGSYNIVVDPSGERLFVGLNSGALDTDDSTFGHVVLAVIDLA